MQIKYFFIIFTLLLFNSITYADDWKCSGTKATGFSFKNGNWEYTNFNTNEYLIEHVGLEGTLNIAYWIYEDGIEGPSHWCANDFNEIGTLRCGFNDAYDIFQFNKKNLRFTRSRHGDYNHVLPGTNKITDQSALEPFTEIGECRRL